ncbi:MAG: tryptophan-rich sensory protein [Actinomycetota bacterium]|nr:tryptophan-rich sensory protein [Actinomycetota bacterium]
MKNLLSVTGIGLVFIYAIGSSLWVNTRDNWYRSLNAPAWQPPDFIFGVIWPYNFVVLGIAAYIVSNRLSTPKALIYLSLFAISIICALTWAYQFYRPHNLVAASIALALVALFTLPMMFFIYQASVYLFICVIPYQLWVITASTLSYQYSKLN